MNWKIGLIIWAKGLAIFTGLGLVAFPLGLYASAIALLISWVAVPIYATGLWCVKKRSISFRIALLVMLVLMAPLAVGASLLVLKYGGDEWIEFSSHVTFLIPLLCCLTAIAISSNSIRLYLQPEDETGKYITE